MNKPTIAQMLNELLLDSAVEVNGIKRHNLTKLAKKIGVTHQGLGLIISGKSPEETIRVKTREHIEVYYISIFQHFSNKMD